VPDYQLSVIAMAIGWPVQLDVAAPLLLARQGRHTVVVIAVVDCPSLLVKLQLLLIGKIDIHSLFTKRLSPIRRVIKILFYL
jgi:hypothetical protein